MRDHAKLAGLGAETAQLLKLALSFAPWLALLVLARNNLVHVQAGLLIGATLAIGLAVARVNKGVILWASLAFFAGATVMIVVLNDMWTLRHLGVLGNGTLAIVTWGSVLAGRPFTLEYAKEHADPALWTSPAFLRTNSVIASVWALAFSVNTVLAFGKMEGLLMPPFGYHIASNATLIAAALFTVRYPRSAQRKVANL